MEAQAGRPRLRELVRRPFADVGAATPFGRLALVHVLMICGDTLVAVALAGSLFFSISPEAARAKVALYLLLTMAPFALIGPLLGPVLDRGHRIRRLVVICSAAARVVLCVFMARDVHSLLLFPEAFLVLVASKIYMVSKAAIVPATVRTKEELVRANSRLALLAAITGLVAGAPAAAVLKLAGAPWVLRLDAVVLLAAAVAATRLPRTTRIGSDAAEASVQVGPDVLGGRPRAAGATQAAALGPAAAGERRRMASRRLQAQTWAPVTLVAASAMAVLRGSVGFVTFQLAFTLRREHAALYWFGVLLVAGVAGSLLGALVAPWMRRRIREENILLVGLGIVAFTGVGVAVINQLWAQSLLAMVVGLAASFGKLGFDSLVQREAPEATYGRAFARFETRFQLAWVVGALLPVALTLAPRDGDIVAAMVSAVGALFYAGARRALTSHVAAEPGAVAGDARPEPPRDSIRRSPR